MCIVRRMRFLPAAFAAILLIAASLRASDLPTVKAPLPELTTAGNVVPSIDLRDFFEVADIHGQVVQFRTAAGNFNIEMLPAAAPASVANFLSYVNGARYAGTFIHRSDLGLGVIQGGGYAVTNPAPLSIARIATDPPIALEYNLPNTRGTIAMARTSAPNSATSEWFINTVDNTTTLGAGNNGGYAVFGRVAGTGMTVVDAIHALQVYAFNSPFGQLPLIGYPGTGSVVGTNLVMMNAAEAVPIFPAAAGQNAVVSFSVTNSNPGLVTATVSGSALNFALAAGQTGFADLTVTATDTNGNAVQNSFRLNVTAVAPDIAVEEPAGTDIADGGSRAFPSVSVGGTTDLVFTIKNMGNGELALTGTPKAKLDGADASQFVVITQPASPVAAISGSGTFTVRFAPTSGGVKTAELHIASDDGDEAAFAIALTGTALAPEIAVEQPAGSDLPGGGSRAFPVVTLGNSADLVFMIRNTGAGDLSLTGVPKVAVVGTDAGQFAVVAQPASPVAGISGSTTFRVRFTPTSGGVKTAALHIVNNDEDESTFDIFLTGTGNARPTLALPDSPFFAEATSPSGAVVTFSVTADDAEDGPLTPTVAPVSGSTFPFGETTVNVSAIDSKGAQITGSFTVMVGFQRAAATTANVGARSGEPAPGAGSGALPTGTLLATFGAPAVSDFRELAARVTLLAGRTKLAGIYTEDGTGAPSLAAHQGGPVPGIPTEGVTFKSFLDPVIAPGGALAFAGTVQGGGVKATADFGVWTNAFGPAVELVLREGSDVPGLPAGARLKAVPSLSLRDGELLARVTLSASKGVVTAADDTVLLRMTSAGTATVLLREGSDYAGSKIKSFSVLSPALGSPGHGRWHANDVVVAKVVLFDGRTLLVKIAPAGTVTPLLSTADAATPVDPQAKWKSFGLPSVGSAGTGFAVAAVLQQKLGGVLAANDTVLLFTADGAAWSVFAREGAAAPVTPAGPLYASFFDPLIDDAGHVAFLATLQGAGIKAANKTGLFSGPTNDLRLVARLGDPVPDESGTATSAVWKKFTSLALPGGAGAGVIFLAETGGGDTTAKNKLALWAVDSHGALRRLLRTGATLTPGGSPLTGITLLNAVPGAFGAARSYNSAGAVALLATFADKTQTLLRVDIP